MISIVVSTFKQDLFEQFERNVGSSIGLEYEIIKIWNPGLYGICEAYNLGAAKAKFDIVIFSHDDLIFKTQNWGRIIYDKLNDRDKNKGTGAIGFAGSSYLPYVFTGWGGYLMGHEKINVYQHFKYQNFNSYHLLYGEPHQNQAVALDGLFIATKKYIWQEFKFDEKSFKNFHFYDVDFTLRIASKYKIEISYDILVEHLSEGNYDRNWLNEFAFFYNKWKDKLPISLDNKTIPQVDRLGEYQLLILHVGNGASIFKYLRVVLSKKYIQIVGLKFIVIMLLKLPIRYWRIKSKKRK